jgi:hypothetical protein
MSVSQMVNLKPLPVKLITPDETYEEDMFFMVVSERQIGKRTENPFP